MNLFDFFAERVAETVESTDHLEINESAEKERQADARRRVNEEERVRRSRHNQKEE